MVQSAKGYKCPKCKKSHLWWLLPIPKNKTYDEAREDKSLFQCQKCGVPYEETFIETVSHEDVKSYK